LHVESGGCPGIRLREEEGTRYDQRSRDMGKCVLIIHQNAGIRNLIADMFVDTGGHVTAIEEVARGLVVAASNRFDLIIVDRSFVCRNGESLPDWLKKSGVEAPVITAAPEDAWIGGGQMMELSVAQDM
jgi:hypothetical protein